MQYLGIMISVRFNLVNFIISFSNLRALSVDHGLEVLSEHVQKTNFPWLMSNVVDNETGRPLGGGKITHFFFHNDVRVGLIGLVEKEWLDTLPAIDPKEVTFIDFVKAGNQLADELINEVN